MDSFVHTSISCHQQILWFPMRVHFLPETILPFGKHCLPAKVASLTSSVAKRFHAPRFGMHKNPVSRHIPRDSIHMCVQFLQGGEGSDYYQWCLFCYTNGIPIDQPQQEGLLLAGAPSGHGPAHVGMMFQQPGGLPPPAGGLPPPSEFQPPAGLPPPSGLPPPAITSPQQHIPSPLPQPGGPIPPEVASGFDQVLHVLQGSQVTCKYFMPLIDLYLKCAMQTQHLVLHSCHPPLHHEHAVTWCYECTVIESS